MSREIRKVQRSIRHLEQNLRAGSARGVRKVAMHAYRKLILETPKGYTGQTRRSWKILSLGSSTSGVGFSVVNSSKVMRYLEHGTKSHGPRKSKFLFIPLNRKTAMSGFGKSSEFGKDYVLTKRVKGITPMKIVEKRGRIVDRQVDAMLNAVANDCLRMFARG